MKLKEWLDEQQLKQVDLVELFATNGNEVTQGCINKWVNNNFDELQSYTQRFLRHLLLII